MSARGKFAKDTMVPWERSRAEIERNLKRYGASEFAYASRDTQAMIGFRVGARSIRMILPLPSIHDDDVMFRVEQYSHNRVRCTPAQAEARLDDAVKQKWRALNLIVLAKLEAIESGIASFEDEFLPYTVLPTGQTFAEWARPQLDELGAGAMPPMLAGGRG